MSKGATAPLIIIGAARSGTNMLRDVVLRFPGYVTWGCDEINYIWRRGNARHPDDELGPEYATERVRQFVRRAFDRIAEVHGGECVVEKTCANSLRVRFVREIFPDARFVFLLRDGRDAISSAMKRWRGDARLGYLLRKARYVPLTDVPYYGARFLRSRMRRFVSSDRRVGTWGPRFKGMDEISDRTPLAKLCALQWSRSVEIASRDLDSLPSSRVLQIRYESFTRHPELGIRSLADFLEATLRDDEIRRIAEGISDRSVGNWRTELSEQDQRLIEPIACELLDRYGYDTPADFPETEGIRPSHEKDA